MFSEPCSPLTLLDFLILGISICCCLSHSLNWLLANGFGLSVKGSVICSLTDLSLDCNELTLSYWVCNCISRAKCSPLTFLTLGYWVFQSKVLLCGCLGHSLNCLLAIGFGGSVYHLGVCYTFTD